MRNKDILACDLSFALHSAYFLRNRVLICCYLVISITFNNEKIYYRSPGSVDCCTTDIFSQICIYVCFSISACEAAVPLAYLRHMFSAYLSAFSTCDECVCANFQILWNYCFIPSFLNKTPSYSFVYNRD